MYIILENIEVLLTHTRHFALIGAAVVGIITLGTGPRGTRAALVSTVWEEKENEILCIIVRK